MSGKQDRISRGTLIGLAGVFVIAVVFRFSCSYSGGHASVAVDDRCQDSLLRLIERVEMRLNHFRRDSLHRDSLRRARKDSVKAHRDSVKAVRASGKRKGRNSGNVRRTYARDYLSEEIQSSK